MHRILLVLLVSCVSRYSYERCSDDSMCANGGTCRFDECVPNGAAKEGEVCSNAQQCSDGLFCPPGIPLCSRPCTKPYAINSECGADAVCVCLSPIATTPASSPAVLALQRSARRSKATLTVRAMMVS